MRRAFSYVRFSNPEQLEGRSLQRQREQALAYCKRNKLTLDERSYQDLGVSGFTGGNATHGELGEFLALVKERRIPKGSVLLIENVDRLSRLPPDEATAVLMDIVKAGVDVHTLMPEAVYTADSIHKTGTWVPLQVAVCLAHEESKKKSERLADAWDDKRDKLATEKFSKRGPAWLKLTADRSAWVVQEDKAQLVRKMFKLYLAGHGCARIAGELHKDCPEGLTGRGWQPGYIRDLLRSRSVLGEYQPHRGTCAKKGKKATRQPVGDPIKNYFPPIIDEATFYRAQQILDHRRSGGGAVPDRATNLFTGMLYNAEDGERMVLSTSNGKPVLVSGGAIRMKSGCPFRSIPAALFETAVLAELKELKPDDVLGGDQEPAANRLDAMRGRRAALEKKIATVQARAEAADDVTEFLDLLATLGKQRKALAEQITEAEAEVASQPASNLADLQALLARLKGGRSKERDELRRRLRAALRRLVSSIWVLIVPRGAYRLVAIQVYFRGGLFRDYRVFYRLARKGRPAAWCCSWSRKRKEVDPANVGFSFDDVGFPVDPDDGGIDPATGREFHLSGLDRADLRLREQAGWVKGDLERDPLEMVDEVLAERGQPLPTD
jgi:DNA invertase Pin-like site-specific DNA recombinase